MNMKKLNFRKSLVESLEARIAPAALVTYPKPVDAEWIPLPLGTPIQLFAGQGLSTLGDRQGSYLLFVEKGSVIVFTQDYDGDDTFDANEITGIAAGDGLRLISFVDIHGDIVTNLKETIVKEDRNGVVLDRSILTLSDSDNNPSNDSQGLKGDGRVLLNNTIERIELRPLRVADLVDQNNDLVVDDADLALRQPPKSTFSIYGSIYAGRGFGAEDGGLIFNPTGLDEFGGVVLGAPTDFLPMINSIRTGTAVNGQYYSFGVSGEYRFGTTKFQLGDDLSGIMSAFIPATGADGGSINTVKSYNSPLNTNTNLVTPFNVNFIIAGNGGAGGSGGNIRNIEMNSDDANGYQIIAGNGGAGRSGGAGGSIVNFADIGSHTGLVILSGGDGGAGGIGNGGSAGNSEFSNITIKGNVHIDMGDGGRGFTNGGNGASLARGIFKEPVDLTTRGLNGWGTTHYPDSSTGSFTARLGVSVPIDFNEDGEGDFVYTTSGASQMVVMISDPLLDTDPADTGFLTFPAPDGLPLQGLYLSGPRNAKALSVGDVNGDGHMDIVAASRDYGGTGDLQVFLSKYEDLNNDGILSSDEDLNGNKVDDFIGFYEPRHSTIPILNRNSFGVNDLAIGDFDGDGRPEIVVGAGTNAVFMLADLELNPATGTKEYTGQFYYDYGHKTVKLDGLTFAADLKFSFFTVTPGADKFHVRTSTAGGIAPYRPVALEASVITVAGDTFDVVFASAWGFDEVQVINWSTPIRNHVNPAVPDRPEAMSGTAVGYDLGVVDIDRNPAPAIVIQPYRLYDFTIVDFTNDGIADVSAISLDEDAHSGFINGSVGLGGAIGQAAGIVEDNAGNYMELPFRGSGWRSMFTIRATDADGDGAIDDAVVSHEIGAFTIEWIEFFGVYYAFESYLTGQEHRTFPRSVGDNGENETTHAFADPIYDDVNSLTATNYYGIGWTDSESIHFGSGVVAQPLINAIFTTQPYIELELNITAGNGGLGLVGKGGNGGYIGGASTHLNVVDPVSGAPVLDPFTGIPVVQLVGAIQIAPSVTVQIEAGNGGEGFSSGGLGGGISGVAIYGGANDHRLHAGDGGRGVFGLGGAGGNLISNVRLGGIEFIAGNGGTGKSGGAGGSVIGSGSSYDVFDSSVAVIAGDGGLGTVNGGSGGSIVNFRSRIPDPADPFGLGVPVPSVPGARLAQYLYLEAGDGGSAVTGRGGDGGSVTNSSPAVGIQLLGEVIVYAGDGGIGNTGGNGGSISNFSIYPDGSNNDYMPKFVTLLAGNGGNGFTGKGGNGGGISNLNVVGLSSETFVTSNIVSKYRKYQDASRFHFNRLIAGNGGSSAGNEGGSGGSVSNVVAFTPLGSYAIVGGAGGDSLRQGGVGGSASNIRVDFGASSISKALIAAGAGGDATSFILNPIDRTPNQKANAYGGKIGKGGNGGEVNGVTQKGALDPHLDIVAGDGGSTIHYGTVLDKKGYVGIGGSVKNLNLAASLGNSSPSVALKSYNDVLLGESFAQFVQTDLINEQRPQGVPANAKALLDDGLGNVGVIVGAAGRNKSYVLDPDNRPAIYTSVPSKTGKNGTLETVFARNLIAAVAGSVDRIASIQLYKGVLIANATGSDKTSRLVQVPGGLPNLVDDFADATGIQTTTHEPVLEGIMVDGAIVAKKFVNSKGGKIAPPLRGFLR